MSFLDSAQDFISDNPSALGLGALAVGGAGLGLMLGQGESPLPSEFGTLTSSVPTLRSQGSALFNTGQGLIEQGQGALAMAQAGQLTAPQQAQLNQYERGLNNQAIQTYASMGRDYNHDTSAISTSANIRAQVNAMAQQDIQSTIALGMSELQAGGSFTGQALGFESAANQALIAAGNAQVQLDKDYRQSLSSAFSAIGTMFGGAMKAFI